MNQPGEHGPTFQEQPGRPTTGRTEASGMMGAVKEKAQELGSAVAGGAERAWEGTKEKTREWAREVAERAETGWEGLGNLIRRYPVASLLGAFGIGFLLGGSLTFGSRRSQS
jgi:hypothetical protein